MKRIQVLYFASLREHANVSSESVETQTETPLALYEELRLRHTLPLPVEQVKFAVADSYIDAEASLEDGMELLIIPPVAGG